MQKKIKIHPAPILDSVFILQKATGESPKFTSAVFFHGLISTGLSRDLLRIIIWTQVIRHMKFNSPSNICIYTHTSKYRGSEKTVSERGRERVREIMRTSSYFIVIVLEGHNKQM